MKAARPISSRLPTQSSRTSAREKVCLPISTGRAPASDLVTLREHCRKLADESGSTDLEQIADTIESHVRAEKGLPPNLDWPSARLRSGDPARALPQAGR